MRNCRTYGHQKQQTIFMCQTFFQDSRGNPYLFKARNHVSTVSVQDVEDARPDHDDQSHKRQEARRENTGRLKLWICAAYMQ